jgi:hypothetical protein
MCKMLFYESIAFDASQILHLVVKGGKTVAEPWRFSVKAAKDIYYMF